jgi:hypothetical protein
MGRRLLSSALRGAHGFVLERHVERHAFALPSRTPPPVKGALAVYGKKRMRIATSVIVGPGLSSPRFVQPVT